MKKVLSVLSGLLFFGMAMGQSIDRQVISSYGNLSSATSATVGEGVIATLTVSGMYTLNQGFQQAPKNTGTSLRDQEIEVSYQLYPNPASEGLNIELKTTGSTELALRIVNNLGQILRESKAAFNGKKSIQFELGDLPSGFYILALVDMQSKYTQNIEFIKR